MGVSDLFENLFGKVEAGAGAAAAAAAPAASAAGGAAGASTTRRRSDSAPRRGEFHVSLSGEGAGCAIGSLVTRGTVALGQQGGSRGGD